MAQPYIEIGVTGVSEVAKQTERSAFRAVFDTSRAPDDVDSEYMYYYAVEAAALDSNATTSLFGPMGTTDLIDDDLWVTEGVFAALWVPLSNTDAYVVTVDWPAKSNMLIVSRSQGSLTEPDDTLSDERNDYFFEPALFESVQFNTNLGEMVWQNGSFVTGPFVTQGGFSVWVRDYTPPAPECPGDINGDGDLNFLDVSKFLKDFRMGCE